MAKTSLTHIKQELVTYLRNKDIIPTDIRGVTTSTDEGTFDSENTYTLSTNPTLIKNVRSVTVDSNLLKFGADYTIDYSTGVITFTTAQTGAYSIVYDQGQTDRIFPDFPQPYLKLNNFPRIAVDVISGTSNEFGIGAKPTQSEYIVSIVCYDANQDTVETMLDKIRSNLIDDKKNFYYIPFLTLTSMGPLLATPFGQNKIMQRNQDVMIKFVFEQ